MIAPGRYGLLVTNGAYQTLAGTVTVGADTSSRSTDTPGGTSFTTPGSANNPVNVQVRNVGGFDELQLNTAAFSAHLFLLQPGIDGRIRVSGQDSYAIGEMFRI